MWKEKLLTLSPNLRSNVLPLFLAITGLLLLSFGLISSIIGNPKTEEIVFEKGTEQSEGSKIVIDIQGAVVSPGVYTLEGDVRIKDALIAAFGLSSDADREWIAKNINQAAKIQDGAKIYIPKYGESLSASKGLETSAGLVSASGLININSASKSELESLPGVGPVTAGKIIDNRPYTAIDELKAKKVVGQNVFEKIKDKISIY